MKLSPFCKIIYHSLNWKFGVDRDNHNISFYMHKQYTMSGAQHESAKKTSSLYFTPLQRDAESTSLQSEINYGTGKPGVHLHISSGDISNLYMTKGYR